MVIQNTLIKLYLHIRYNIINIVSSLETNFKLYFIFLELYIFKFYLEK